MSKCLVVEDSRLARNELIKMLKELDSFDQIEEAASGEEAVNRMKEFQPDVIFLDIHLPGDDGI